MSEHIEIFKPNRDRDIQRLIAAKEIEAKMKGKLKRVKLMNGYAYSLDATKWKGDQYENRSFEKQVKRTDPACGHSRKRNEEPDETESIGFSEIIEEGY